MVIDVQTFDIPRLVTVYPDRFGVRWWTKSWFNGSDIGEPSVEIEEQIAICFLLSKITKSEMLEEYYPTQMEAYRNAIEQTKSQLLNQLNLT